jgi:outer membrane protein assembly factor BamB
MRTALVLGLIGQAAVWSLARAWPMPLHAAPTAMVTDQRDNVLAIVSGRVHGGDRSYKYLVVKVDPQGHLRWRHLVHATGKYPSVEVRALVSAPGGDVVAVGTIDDVHGEGFLVTRLAGGNGRERWRSTLRGTPPSGAYNEGAAAAMDAKGDVIAAGSLLNGEGPGEFGSLAVVKLDGLTGAERWRFKPTPPGQENSGANVLAVDPAGDVVAAGIFSPIVPGVVTPITVTVVKLAGDAGTLVWRRDVDVAFQVNAVAIDPAGDVLLAVSTRETGQSDFGVVKVAGSSGEILWVARENGGGGFQEAARVVADGSGTVFAAGMTNDGSDNVGGDVFTVVALDGESGARRWVYQTRSAGPFGAAARELQRMPSGLVIAAGETQDAKLCSDALVVALDSGTGAPVWSETFDAKLTAPSCEAHCRVAGRRSCPAVESLSSTAVSRDGRVFAGLTVATGSGLRRRLSGVIRRVH